MAKLKGIVMEFIASGLDSVAAVQSIPVPNKTDAAYFLKIHNAYRALIEHEKVPGMPKPNYMPEMEWDAELEDEARSHAEQCTDSVWDKWGTVVGWSDKKEHEPLHDAFNQISLFLQEPKPYYKKYEHFAQMITANSRRLGCARHYCQETSEYITVCKYWAKYKEKFVMPYTGNFTTPYTVEYCGACPLEMFPEMANDTRRRQKDRPEGAFRPGPYLPPPVVDSTYFLDIHNGYRDWLRSGKPRVVAKAFYMAKMEWDPILENAARRHAESCAIEESFPMDDIKTIFEGKKLDKPNSQLIHRWFDMHLAGYYVFNGFFGPHNPSTTFMWAISKSLGCWETRCGPYEGYFSNYYNEPIFFMDATIMVCKYRPLFNQARFYPYIETEPVIPPKPTLAPTSPDMPDAEYYVKQHNLYRAKLRNGEVQGQPAAKDMPDLTWDKNLASIARDLGNTCQFSRHYIDNRGGGNIGFSSEGSTDFVHRWFRGHESYVYGNTTYNPTDASAAYTQMVWAKSLKVGCFKMFCARLTKGDVDYYQQYFITCVYSPAGNVDGELPYVKQD